MRDVCLFGDCRESMRQMIADGVKVQSCVTSPPYWGLRDYGTATWNGGDDACLHRVPATGSTQNKGNNNREGTPFVGDCGLCGATRVDSQLGLESTPEDYVANMVEVFRLVRELLADDGTLWLNLGDSYAGSSQQGQNNLAASVASTRGGAKKIDGERFDIKREMPNGLKPKDLVGIPWRVAFALQADGWYLRSDIIWAKPNPMPESVTDRPTKAHEYLFLLSKRERYFYDADAIREPLKEGADHDRPVNGHAGPNSSNTKAFGIGDTHVMRSNSAGRNRRTVWTVATEPYSEAHFATFPTALIEPCILAGTSQKGHCPACGKGWARVVESQRGFDDAGKCRGCGAPRNKHVISGKNRDKNGFGLGMSATMQADGAVPCGVNATLGWRPSCACNLDPVPGIVFDPFLGSGTTAQVAQDLGRHWLGCELNAQYCDLQKRRAAQMGLALSV